MDSGLEAHTEFGSQEGNNPFLYIVLPKHLRNSKVHEQLLKNSQQLITAHDLHSTLKDILYFQPKSMFTDLEFKRFDSNPRGSSLLREFERGVKRTCKTLPIPFQFCMCQYEKKTITDRMKVTALGNFAAKEMASILESNNVSSQCEKITMHKVVMVKEFMLQNITLSGSHFYEITFIVALPAYGKFKIPIRADERGKLELAGDKFERLDRYGNKGDCMELLELRSLCTCVNLNTSP
ncbi:hypothetical protein OSTOST_10393, partial [Ostertagia ostertagi]